MCNTIAATGATIGKLIILAQRYFILKSLSFDEQKWSGSTMRRLIFIQFFIPTLISLFYAFGNMKTKLTKEGVLVLNGGEDRLTVAIKVCNNTIYAIYIISGFAFALLFSRSYKRMKRHAEAETKSNLVNKQRVMIIFVLGCTIAHLIKSIHQIVWTIAAAIGNQAMIDAVYPLYTYANGIANFASPVILLLCFRRVRWLLVEGCIDRPRKRTAISSTHQSISNDKMD
ncbi:hypothetical protein PFISCL1PPCAC_10307, partial [Pristionchus fissidentatus]